MSPKAVISGWIGLLLPFWWVNVDEEGGEEGDGFESCGEHTDRQFSFFLHETDRPATHTNIHPHRLAFLTDPTPPPGPPSKPHT